MAGLGTIQHGILSRSSLKTSHNEGGVVSLTQAKAGYTYFKMEISHNHYQVQTIGRFFHGRFIFIHMDTVVELIR